MRQAAVGQKCPRCARLPRSAKAMGKPIHYVKGGGAGLAVALAGGLLLMATGRFGFGSIFLPALLGFGVGKAVAWGAQRQTHRNFEMMAIALGVLGGFLAGGGLVIINRPFSLLGVAAAGYMALRGLRG